MHVKLHLPKSRFSDPHCFSLLVRSSADQNLLTWEDGEILKCFSSLDAHIFKKNCRNNMKCQLVKADYSGEKVILGSSHYFDKTKVNTTTYVCF